MESGLRHLFWIEELLSADMIPRKMHGGVGYYLEDKLVLILVDSSLTYEHRGRSYPFQVWNGCIIPVEKIKQSAVWVQFQFLENHPANKDWLYIPAESEEIEEQIKLVLKQIKKRNPLFGIPVKMKASDVKQEEMVEDDLSKPRMFVHGPVKKALSKKKSKPKSSKSSSQKPKADKKRENAFVLSVLKGKN
jgi:hypothetical protein